MWTATHPTSMPVHHLEQNSQGSYAMATGPIFSHRCAVPAPLRISPKPASDPGHAQQQASPDPRGGGGGGGATPCTLRSKLPGQPVFDPAEGFSHESLRTTNKCSCPKSPASPIPSPLSPRQSFLGTSSSSRRSSTSTSTSASRGPSLDFSSLFMRSETLRHELETCACHHPGDIAAAKPAGFPVPAVPAVPGRGCYHRRDSNSSGYTSFYSN